MPRVCGRLQLEGVNKDIVADIASTIEVMENIVRFERRFGSLSRKLATAVVLRRAWHPALSIHPRCLFLRKRCLSYVSYAKIE